MKNPARILVLEDDAPLREILVSVLQDEGLEVEAVARGEEAVAICSRKLFDLVILDVRLPGIDGLEALARMADDLKEAAVLVITGYASEADSIRALRLGAADYLHKPFELELFLERVGQLLQLTARRRAQRQRLRDLQKLYSSTLKLLVDLFSASPWEAERAKFAQESAQRASHLAQKFQVESPLAQEIELGALLKALLPPAQSALAWEGEPALATLSAIWHNLPHLASHVVQRALSSTEEPSKPPAATLPGQSEALFIGLALESAGASGEAEALFTSLIAEDESPIQVEAYLALARLCAPQYPHSPLETYLQRALRLAQPWGPALWAQTATEAFLLGRNYLGPELAQPWGELAWQLANDFQLQPHLARLTWARTTGEASQWQSLKTALEELSQPRWASLIKRDLPWFCHSAAQIWRQAPDPPSPLWEELSRQLARFLAAQAPALKRLEEKGGCSQETSRALRELLSHWRQEVPYSVGRLLDLSRWRLAPAGTESHWQRPLRLKIASLGRVELFLNGQSLGQGEEKLSKSLYLLLRLALSPQPLPWARLEEDFWSHSPATARANLRKQLSCLRLLCRRLELPYPILTTSSSELRLLPSLEVEFDALLVEGLCQKGAENPHLSRELQRLYGGPFLPHSPWDWALNYRLYLEQKVLRSMENWLERAQKRAQWEEVRLGALWCQEIDPCHEKSCAQLLQAYLHLGQPQLGREYYRRFAQRLHRRFQLQPSPQLRQLCQSLGR